MGKTRSSFGDDLRAPETPRRDARARFSLTRFLLRAGGRQTSIRQGAEWRTSFSHFDGGVESDDVSFGFLMRQCAAAIEGARGLTDRKARELARALDAAGSGEARLAAWGARLIIALFWVFIGLVLAREASFGLPTRGLSADAAAMLARIFVGVGVLAAAAALIGGNLARASASAVATDDSLGAEAGMIARDFARAIRSLRERIAEESGPAALGDLSRLHLVAVEAAAFLESVSFLPEADHARAAEKFRAFIAGRSEDPGAPAGAVAAALLLGGLIGAVIGRSAEIAGGAGLPLWAVAALPGFALVYAAVGGLFSLVATGASALVQDAALSRLRKAYVAAGAPRLDEMIAEVEGAHADFHRRLGGGDRRSAEAGDAIEAAEFAWRTPAKAARFVAPTFEGAPPVFRTERQAPRAQKFWKKFFASRGRNAAPKQSAGAPDAPPKLKD